MFRAALRLARPAALLAVAVMAVACVGSAGAAGPTPTASPSPKPVDPDKVIFRVTWDGGFVSPDMLLGRLPLVVVYADGRVITQGPQIEIFPGPFMPNLVEHTLSAEALERLAELAREKDLLKNVHYDYPGIADAADTVLEVNLDGKTYRVSAYALAEAGLDAEGAPGFDLDEETREGRAALREFIDALTGVPPSDYVDEEHPYAFESLRLYARVAEIVENSEFPGEQPPVAWPLEDLAAAGAALDNPAIDGLRCQVLEGEALETVLPVLNGANQLSVFESADEYYSLIAVPLLPGEAGC